MVESQQTLSTQASGTLPAPNTGRKNGVGECTVAIPCVCLCVCVCCVCVRVRVCLCLVGIKSLGFCPKMTLNLAEAGAFECNANDI